MLPALKRASQLLSKLPGVGERTAQRYLFHLLGERPELCEELGHALLSLHTSVGACARCGNFAERGAPEDEPICEICADGKRDDTLLCVVGKVQDLLAIERTHSMRGRYFVLGRLLSPLDGVGPEALPLPALRRRIEAGVREVIVATPPSVEGEATALFLKRELEGADVRMSRIASGVPHGGELEYADPITMGRALEGRKSL